MTKITVSTAVNRPIAEIWSQYTEPKHITGWNFASEDWCCPRAEVDLRPGGRHIARMEARDGSFGFDFEATYDIVDPPNHLTMKLDDGRVVETRLGQNGVQTTVTTEFDADDAHPVDFQQEGWQAILDNFKAYAERT